jgi:histidine ammonia-lyase
VKVKRTFINRAFFVKERRFAVVTLTGHSLTLEEISLVLYKDEKVEIAPESLQNVEASRRAVEAIVEKGRVV